MFADVRALQQLWVAPPPNTINTWAEPQNALGVTPNRVANSNEVVGNNSCYPAWEGTCPLPLAETKAEAQVTSSDCVLGGSPAIKHLDAAGRANSQMRQRSVMRIEFGNLPPETDTFRLQQRLTSLAGPEVAAHAEYIKRDVLNGQSQGSAYAYFRAVQKGDESVMNAIRTAQAEREKHRQVVRRLMSERPR